MNDWSTSGGTAWTAWHRAPPGARTAVVFVSVFVGVALVTLLTPSAPVVRVAVALVAGWLAAFAFALFGWARAGRAQRGHDDPLRVEPLVAGRELGVRFDESPYLAPPPPTPDARLDPDSTLGEPRWQPAATVQRTDDWDRTVQDRGHGDVDDVFAQHPVDLDAVTARPGNAAEQWDGVAEAPAPPVVDDEQDEFERRVAEFGGVRTPEPATAAEASTDQLLGKLMSLTAERRAPTRSLESDAADRLAEALRALRAVG